MAALVGAAPQDQAPAPQDRPRLEIALAAARWIDSQRVETAGGWAWPVDPRHPDSIARHLYGGTSGVILFLLELHRATADPTWLQRAREGADELVGARDTSAAGLWTGLAGQAFVLHETARASGEERYEAAARARLATIRSIVRAEPRGAVDDQVTDVISGSAGVGLFLLWAAEEMGDGESLELAAAGDWLIAQSEPVELGPQNSGRNWPMVPGGERCMPNFSHGTAGVAFFLARLAQELGEREDAARYLGAAIDGAHYLQSIAVGEEGALVQHHAPGGEDLFYLGWCHGPVGTSRLFELLERITGDDAWGPWVERGAHSILASGIPERPHPGFWNNVGQCCGSAGVASFFLRLHRGSARPEYLAFAYRLSEDMRARASKEADGQAMHWPQAEHRVRPELIVSQTGYMQGAAGVGLWFLELDAFETGRPFGLRLPDELPLD